MDPDIRRLDVTSNNEGIPLPFNKANKGGQDTWRNLWNADNRYLPTRFPTVTRGSGIDDPDNPDSWGSSKFSARSYASGVSPHR